MNIRVKLYLQAFFLKIPLIIQEIKDIFQITFVLPLLSIHGVHINCLVSKNIFANIPRVKLQKHNICITHFVKKS